MIKAGWFLGMQLRIASPVIREFEGQLGFTRRDAGASRSTRPLVLFAFSFSSSGQFLNCTVTRKITKSFRKPREVCFLSVA